MWTSSGTTSFRTIWIKGGLPRILRRVGTFSFVTLLIIKRDLHAPGWQKERDKILAKCHKNSYNYCDAGAQKAFGDCVKGMAGSLMVRRINLLWNTRVWSKHIEWSLNMAPLRCHIAPFLTTRWQIGAQAAIWTALFNSLRNIVQRRVRSVR